MGFSKFYFFAFTMHKGCSSNKFCNGGDRLSDNRAQVVVMIVT